MIVQPPEPHRFTRGGVGVVFGCRRPGQCAMPETTRPPVARRSRPTAGQIPEGSDYFQRWPASMTRAELARAERTSMTRKA
jgi:hypothetical protein